MKLKFFTSNNADLLKTDAKYFREALDGLLQMYEQSKADSEDNVELRAMAVSNLAGLGLAIHNHYSNALETLNSLDNTTMQELGMSTYDRAVKHGYLMEKNFVRKIES